MRDRVVLIAFVLLAAELPLSAHVGSPDVFCEGTAGPYRLFVTVRVPQVIPGIAEIEIRSDSPEVKTIRVVPLRLTGQGSKFPPTPDLAQPSKDDPQFFTASLWLMEFGALQVRILADGEKGKGELSVPVPAFAQRSLPMQKPLRWLLLMLAAFLAISIVSIVGAGVREGELERGKSPGPANARRARIVMAITAVAVLAILYLGKSWWHAEASNYQRSINFFKPPAAKVTLENGNRLVIAAKGQDPKWSDFVSLEDAIPDHGHLMHLFLIHAPQLDRLWHLHPERISGGAFSEDLPSMPGGRYEIFADIVSKTGYPWTLVGSVDLPQINGGTLAGDDSTWSGAPLTSTALARSDPRISLLPDGSRMVWQLPDGPLKANATLHFKFLIEDRDGKPAQDLQPYMGMACHVEFVRSDLTVFAHVHPAGSVSMAALELAESGLAHGTQAGAESRQKTAAQMAMSMPMASTILPPEVSVPYGFPQPGEYRIFVQIKRSDRVETVAFDARVQ
jgi:hypothetical protein